MSSYKNAPRLDATNIAGITTLMNTQHIKDKINLQQVEDSIMNKHKNNKVDTEEYDPVKFYTNEINRLADELGVDLVSNNYFNQPVILNNIDEQPQIKNKLVPDISDINLNYKNVSFKIDSSDIGEESKNDDDKESSISSDSNTSKTSKSSKLSKSSKASEPVDIDNFMRSLNNNVGIDLSDNKYKDRYTVPNINESYPKNKNKSVVDNVLTDMFNESKTIHGTEREKVKDIKTSKIEQISQLRLTLEEEGINCNNIKHPNNDTPLEEIDSILNILRLKNDRNRYSTLAEEVILGMAEGIETVFDGTREIPFVKWTPDYRGYHSTVNIKLHRMRFETSQVVGSIIEKYNIHPTARIIMELLPSFFLYPRQQSKQRSSPGLHSDPKVSDARLAYASIKEAEDKKNAEFLENI
jgi:hypothetical protein